MDLSIIILNYKSKIKLLNCLESIEKNRSLRLSYEVIVVDNNSGDELGDVVLNYPGVKLILSPKNIGMGGGNNLGIAASSGQYILILNPDTIIKGQAIATLWDYLKQHPKVGLVGPKILYPDGSLQLSCSRWPQFFLPFLRRTFIGNFFKSAQDNFTMQNFDHDTISVVDWLMGSCLMFKKEVQLKDKVFSPRFDDRYFMYFEDTDLARQFWTNNLAVVYNPEALIMHDHGRGSAEYPWYLAIFLSSLARRHIISWLKYFGKWGLKKLNHSSNL